MFNKNRNKFYLIFFLQFIIITCFASSSKSKISFFDSLNVPDNVPFFDENGEKCFLDQIENKTILLVFWATWCAPCVKEMPDLDILQKDFRKLPFEIIAVSQDFQGVKVVQEFFKTQEIRHLKIYHDYHNQLFKAFSVVGLPTSFLINQDGKVVVRFSGNINWYDGETRSMLLSHIPGNPSEPKNSYKAESMNQQIKSIRQKEQPPIDVNQKSEPNQQDQKK